jgi:uncharacterized membrane protein YgaE (UPF0421/DUF939 family)
MILGLLAGILVGEALLSAPIYSPELRIIFISFLAMLAALTFGLAPVIAIQAGVSAILVITLGPVTAGPMRLVDAAVGAVVALIFSQVLFTPNPMHLIDPEKARILRLMGQGFELEADALATRDAVKAEAALQHFWLARDSLNALRTEINTARSSMRWSLRGRVDAGRVVERIARYERRAVRLFASTLLFAEAIASSLQNGMEPPVGLQNRVRSIAALCEILAEDLAVSPNLISPQPPEAPLLDSWQTSLEHLRVVEEALHMPKEAAVDARGPAKSSRCTV